MDESSKRCDDAQDSKAQTIKNTGHETVPFPLQHLYMSTSLPSSAIPKQTLFSMEVVLQSILRGKEEIEEEKAETIAQKLAREGIFGVEVMKQVVLKNC
jgi:hypothetical protein